MNLALVLGSSSENVKPKLVTAKDNLNIECFVDIRRFINDAIRRDLIIDRILLLSNLITDDSLIEDLYNYWNENERASEIVLLCKKGADDDLARRFLSTFCSTSVTSMSVESTTLRVLTSAVVLPISKIMEQFGMPDYLNVEVEVDSYEPPKPVVDESTSNKQTDKKEKKTLLGALFGKKSKNGKTDSKKQSNDSQRQTQVNNTIEQRNNNEVQKHVNQEPVYNEEYHEQYDSSEVSEPDNNNYVEYYTPEVEEYSENYEENSDSGSLEVGSEENEYSNEYYPEYEEPQSEELEEEFTSNESLEYSEDSNIEEVNEDFNFGSDADESTDDSTLEDEFTGASDEGVSESMSWESEEPEWGTSEDENTVEEVDDDFGDLAVSVDNTQNQEPKDNNKSTNVEMVDDISDNLSLGKAEDEYRKKTEQPKVIKETVVKEVVKNVGASSIVDNVCKGLIHKLLVITGDRGSCVTTTAWKLATYFSKYVPVLYFDCDVDRHGLLNYIDYFSFKNYDESHMKGVKLCRSSKAFGSCICKWDTNIDLLTSDFGINVTDDELVLTQGIVAENINNYGIVIVDCPVSKLHCIQDLILTGNSVICMENSIRGIMNMLISMDESPLPLRYKRSIVSKGTLLRMFPDKNTNYKKMMKYVNQIVDLEDCNYLSMETLDYNGNLSKDFLAKILEG